MTDATLNARTRHYIKELSNLNILMAEDSPLNSKLISILFSQNGLKLQTAENGREAVEKIKADHFDIILMDMEMPVMNGYDATAMIRNELNDPIPIIAMTAHTAQGEREKCLETGMNDYISKPINEDLLFAMIYNLTLSKTRQEKNPAITEHVINHEKVCDLSYLLTVTRGNKISMKNIIDVFIEEALEDLSNLGNAIKNINYTEITDISHKIKSAFSILGIASLRPVFEEIEYLGSIQTGIDKIEIQNSRINKVFEKVVEEMERECSVVD